MPKTITFFLAGLLLCFAITGCNKTEKTIASAGDAEHARVGVMIETTGEVIAKERFPQAEIKPFDDIMDAVTALKSRRLDVIVTAYPTAIQVCKKNRELTVLPELLTKEDTSIALRKWEHELLSALNKIIAGLKSDGTLADMSRRWLKDDLAPYEELKLTLPQKGPVLKVGVCATREPISFIDKDGRVTGHDSELARIISVKLNRPIEFVNMKFMELIPALQSGKIDIILSGMTANEKRLQSVDFTQPYLDSAQVMLVRKSSAGKATGKFVPPGK